MKKARSIVNDIVKEIEERVSSPQSDEALLKEFHDRQKEIEDAVLQDFSGGVPRKHVSRIRQLLGNEFIDILNQGKIGPLVWKGKERLERIYQRLASLLALYLHYKKDAQAKTLEVERLKKIQHELIESQVSHIHEVEMLETHLQGYQMLVEIVLEPFEDAMKKIMSFLNAKQIEIFLFDDDRFLAAELKTDGETFTYNQEEEKPEIPESVSEVKLQERKEATLDVPLVVEGKQIGHFRLDRQASGDFDIFQWKRDVEWITSVLARVIASNKNLILARKVYIDDLTQMYNKRKLSEQMGKLFKQFKRGDKELHIVMLDIDKFKHLNDTYGHPVGDEILKQTAVILMEEMPCAYRYGGEEFAGVFYGADKEGTLEIMERLRKRIEKTVYSIEGQDYRITISAGISKFETNMNSVMDAIDMADRALYASKEDGRNRCTDYDDIKDRHSSDNAKLRQEILQLKEQMSLFTQESKRSAGQTNKETGGRIRSGLFEVIINEEIIKGIYQHAVEEYPHECCGIVTGSAEKQILHQCRNIQNELHTEDPERHPRDARTAYAIDRKKADKIYADAGKKGEEVLAFYHSHIDCDAYFSDTDIAAQTVFGEPEFPNALHLVASVVERNILGMKCFKWDKEKERFVTLPLF